MPPRTEPPRQLGVAFQMWLQRHGIPADRLATPEACIDALATFHGAVRFRGRAQGTDADMLLFQTGQPPGGGWVVNTTRQLYSRGRGLQLGLTLRVPEGEAPFPGYGTLWSREFDDIARWTAAAKQALHPPPRRFAGPAAVTLDAF